ncbi:sigma-E factor negative regulatory protein [Deefgea rivuli]|uniref:sigma-E factor negative regulatory protein n=1 Tax=Deefgea rivuli TaxID=400948 RepID=UPI000488D245|nr:sigma-E factor negative regulatory protein [Deefgea rivuli]
MNEKISALMDCEVDRVTASATINEILASNLQQTAWYELHAARDAVQHCPLSPDFMARFSARLALEPIVIAPRRWHKPHFVKSLLLPASAVASVMFVGLAFWQFSMHSVAPSPATMAQAPVVIKSSEISPYLAAHREGLSNSFASEQLAMANFEAGEQR